MWDHMENVPKVITTTAKTPKYIKSDCIAIATEIHVPPPPTSTPPWFSLLATTTQTPSTLSITITLGLRRSAGVLKCVFGYCCSVARTFLLFRLRRVFSKLRTWFGGSRQCHFDWNGAIHETERDRREKIIISPFPSTNICIVQNFHMDLGVVDDLFVIQ